MAVVVFGGFEAVKRACDKTVGGGRVGATNAEARW